MTWIQPNSLGYHTVPLHNMNGTLPAVYLCNSAVLRYIPLKLQLVVRSYTGDTGAAVIFILHSAILYQRLLL